MILTPNLQILLEKNPERAGFRQHYLTLYSIIYGMEPDVVLEEGSGYSTWVILCALEALNKGTLTSIDKNLRLHTLDRYSPNLPSLLPRLTYIQANFKDTHIVDLTSKGVYDVFLQDGSHDETDVAEDVRRIMPRMRKNGLILVHDTMGILAGKNVCKHLNNKYFEAATLPYGYGLTIIRVLKDYGHGSISPKWRK